MAVLGELDGVADQVGEDLADAPRVADHPGGHLGRHAQDQIDALALGGDGEEVQRLLEGGPQIEGKRLDHHLAGFDAREVEDVVDDGKQRLGGAAHRLGVLALLDVQIGVEQEARHADDAVHRGADLVAHVGEELALRLGPRLGRLLGGA